MHQVLNKGLTLSARPDVFAANRANGRVALTAGFDGARTQRKQVHEDGSLRVRFPNVTSDLMEAVLINTAGGMTGGDDFSIHIALDADAKMLACTAAAEKIYRSTGPDTTIALTIDAAAGSRCVWVPQETILFDRSRLSRRIDVNLTADASLVMAEAVVFGRSAMGESVTDGRLIDRWRVRRDDHLLFADNIRLEGPISDILAQPAIAAGAVAIATVLAIPGNEAIAEAVRERNSQFTGEVGISAWNGIAVARLCAREAAALRHDLAIVLAALNTALPRIWLQ